MLWSFEDVLKKRAHLSETMSNKLLEIRFVFADVIL